MTYSIPPKSSHKGQHKHLIRIVRLTLRPEKLTEFLQMFEEIKHKIRSFDGCLHLELLQDTQYANIVTTYSIWQAESYLNQYKNSDFFKEVWPQTKDMFAAPPLAFSNRQMQIVEIK